MESGSRKMSKEQDFIDCYKRLEKISRDLVALYRSDYSFDSFKIDVSKNKFYVFINKDPECQWRLSYRDRYIQMGLPLSLLSMEDSEVFSYISKKIQNRKEDEE